MASLQLPACAAWSNELADYSGYGYRPSLSAGIAFSIVFGIASCAHLLLCWSSRTWYQILFVLGAGIECLGWIARTASHECPFSDSLFIMQTAVLIMGPAWTQAGIYVAAWEVITILGRKASPVAPAVYLITTICCDLVTLVLQATGGGLAGSAYDKGVSPWPGTITMIVGIIAQLVLACIFAVFYSTIFVRGRNVIMKSSGLRLTSLSITIVITCMIWRGFYRSVELIEGWNGYLITHEKYTIALDGVPMALASVTLCFLNPGMLLRGEKQRHREAMQAWVDDSSPEGLPDALLNEKRHANIGGGFTKRQRIARILLG